MRSASRRSALVACFIVSAAASGPAQTLPTYEPEILVITRERVRPGHEEAHTRMQAGRPAVYAQAGWPNYYLALASITGDPEVWFVEPWRTYADWGRAMARRRADPALASALARVAADEASHVEDRQVIEAVAAPELGYGTVPNLNLVRFWRVTTLRVRPGYEAGFAAVMETYRTLAARADPDASWRVYRVANGMPDGTFFIFSSVESFTQFDDKAAAASAVDAAMTAGERESVTQFSMEGLRRTTSNRFRLDPVMSFVSDETRALDPDFWRGPGPAGSVPRPPERRCPF